MKFENVYINISGTIKSVCPNCTQLCYRKFTTSDISPNKNTMPFICLDCGHTWSEPTEKLFSKDIIQNDIIWNCTYISKGGK